MNRIDWNALDETAQRDALARPTQSRAEELRHGVGQIIAAVRERGDTALRELSAKYDRCTLDVIEVDEAEFAAAEVSLDPVLKAAIHEAAARIALFHRAAAPQPVGVDTAPGVRVERMLRPISRVGLYVPAGSAPLPSTALPADAAAVYERFASAYGPFRDQVAVLAHVPPALVHLCDMLMELKARRAVPWRYIELAVVVVSKLNACAYCVSHHAPVLQIEGLSVEAIAVLPGIDHPELDDVDRLVVEYARVVTEQPGRIRDAIFSRLRQHFNDAQIVEMTLRIALVGFYNRFNDALQIDDGVAVVGRALPGETTHEGVSST